jgi:uncharacterized protein (UPF0303 family)
MTMTRPDPTDAELAAEERDLQFDRFDNGVAIALGQAIVSAATGRRLAVTVDVRRGDQVVFHASLEGTTADNDAWVERKVRLVRLLEQSSFRVGCALRREGTTLANARLLDETMFAAHGGAFPIRVRSAGMVGVVTVSGLPQREDHELVVGVLREFLGC